MMSLRLFAAALLGATLIPASASACIRFDRVAEVRVIDRALAASETPAIQKAELKLLRQKMRVSRGTASEQLVAYHNAVTQALKLLGKTRIVQSEPPARPDRRAAAPAPSGCG